MRNLKELEIWNYIWTESLQQKNISCNRCSNSGTRNEEFLLSKEVLNQSWRIRRMLEVLDSNESPTEVPGRLKRPNQTKNSLLLCTKHR